MPSFPAILLALLLPFPAFALCNQPGSGNTQTYDSNGAACVASTPAQMTIVPLDVASVTTLNVAVTALTAGHRNKGGWLLNPSGAAQPLCINEAGATASGTTSAGSLICIAAGASFNLTPSPLAVSVVTSDSAHPFAGEGYN